MATTFPAWLIRTRRLALRRLVADDASDLSGIVEDGWVDAMIAEGSGRTLCPWAVVRVDTGAVVGFCGFFARVRKGTTIGYAIIPDQRGQGFATEAAEAALRYAEDRGVHVYASVRPPNAASVRVLEKIGMRLTTSYHDEDGQRDIYHRPLPQPADLGALSVPQPPNRT